ncbi:hypothetical protein [Lonepinella koalarum]|uniref:Uncharacterized protein n=1 Tax=Lonepinella koalarum TaxID=53417 RepID=A0A4R1KKG9_9PAST|nr:hypothetical protein EV692_2352 [Lonepinella koalarum]
MVFSKNNLPIEFPIPASVNKLICCDLDKNTIHTYGHCLDKPYCHGILSVLEKL